MTATDPRDLVHRYVAVHRGLMVMAERIWHTLLLKEISCSREYASSADLPG